MLRPLSGTQIRQRFLDFYAKKDHQILPSSSLVPEDPTVLLTIAGMLPFKPIFLGQRSPDFPRATTSQKCIRTNDIENVGRTARHHTFFEMLGSFSFGDYFKEQAITWAWELATVEFGLPPEHLAVSVFEDDEEAYGLWRDQIGVSEARIQRLGEADNFWVSGPTGPCGPCSEIYYDFHPEQGDGTIDLEDDRRFIEFYNLVFMEYSRDLAQTLTPLQHKSIDTGMGLERMAQILQGVPNNYETDLIFPIVDTAAGIAGINYGQSGEAAQVSLKVIGDHVRAVIHMIADGITASNLGRGYVLRRLIRRVVRHGRLLGIERPFIIPVAETAIALAAGAYPDVQERRSVIKEELVREEANFLQTLERGEKLLAKIFAQGEPQISGEAAFDLYDTYGFPLELTQEIAGEQGLTVDIAGFEAAMAYQRQRSREAQEMIDLTVQESLDQIHLPPTSFLGYDQTVARAQVMALLVGDQLVETATGGTVVQIALDQTPFYAESGGQIGDRGYFCGPELQVWIEDVQKEQAIFIHHGQIEQGTLCVGDWVTAQVDQGYRQRAEAHHTATHLLQAALKQIVGERISQAGSLVAFDRLRFDFNCPRAVTETELMQIENLINTWITKAQATQIAVMPLTEAKDRGAIAMFGEKYGDQVRVVDVPGVSLELCGGTHVANTAEIGLFKIIAESGVAAGIRRIEAVVGPALLDYLSGRDRIVRALGDRFKAKPEALMGRIEALQTELKATQKQVEVLEQELALARSDQILEQAETVGTFKILVANMGSSDADALKIAAERLRQKLGEGAVVLGSVPGDGKVSLVASFSPEVHQGKGLSAGQFIGRIARLCGGGGGGRPNLAQAGGRDPSQLTTALAEAREQLVASLQ